VKKESVQSVVMDLINTSSIKLNKNLDILVILMFLFMAGALAKKVMSDTLTFLNSIAVIGVVFCLFVVVYVLVEFVIVNALVKRFNQIFPKKSSFRQQAINILKNINTKDSLEKRVLEKLPETSHMTFTQTNSEPVEEQIQKQVLDNLSSPTDTLSKPAVTNFSKTKLKSTPNSTNTFSNQQTNNSANKKLTLHQTIPLDPEETSLMAKMKLVPKSDEKNNKNEKIVNLSQQHKAKSNHNNLPFNHKEDNQNE